MSHDAAECFRCRADLRRMLLRRGPVPAGEALSPGGDRAAKTYRVVCAGCGAVNLLRLPAEERDKK